MAQAPYKIRVKRGDIEIEVEGDKRYVSKTFADLRRLIDSDLVTAQPLSKSGKIPSSPVPSSKPLSVREFLDQYSISRHTDIVLAFGYYLEKRQEVSGFTAVDINRCYYDAKIEPSNTSQMIIQNVKKALMMEAPGSNKGRRKFVLTQKGEKFVEAGFARDKK
jgi:hypothetical protein